MDLISQAEDAAPGSLDSTITPVLTSTGVTNVVGFADTCPGSRAGTLALNYTNTLANDILRSEITPAILHRASNYSGRDPKPRTDMTYLTRQVRTAILSVEKWVDKIKTHNEDQTVTVESAAARGVVQQAADGMCPVFRRKESFAPWASGATKLKPLDFPLHHYDISYDDPQPLSLIHF